MAVRLRDKIIEIYDIKFSKTNFSVDSQIFQFLIFIMNRLNEIRLNSNIFDCNFIPGNSDPSDLCTRYTPFNQLITSQPRFRGSEYTEEQARESIFDLEKIEQVEYLVDSKSINTTLTRKGKC